MAWNRRQWMLVAALVITLGLTWWTSRDDKSVAVSLPTREASPEAARQYRHLAQDIVGGSLHLTKRPLVGMQSDLFEAEKLLTPQPSRSHVVTRKPAVPAVPPLPFKYLGRWQDSASQTVSLDYQGDILTVQAGDIIASGQYKLVTIEESAAGLQIQFLNIPLNKIQLLQIGATP